MKYAVVYLDQDYTKVSVQPLPTNLHQTSVFTTEKEAWKECKRIAKMYGLEVIKNVE